MKNKHTFKLSILLIMVLVLTGCQAISEFVSGFKQDFIGLTMTVQTYDEQAQIIDSMTGKSVSIERDEEFDSQTAEGSTKADSQVLDIQIGGHTMTHVGSSLIAAEKGLNDLTMEVDNRVELYDTRSNLPFISRLQDNLGQTFFGKKKTIMVRSQNGTPLAVYSGNKVSYFKTDVPKSTGLIIDGKYLFIYRCDYTIYDNELLENS
ncbi:DUF5052 family protein [Facklamia miroungae]|uniref:DUF5052 domain-containing protein n=1 Tax=Facklamia miroungae TaxID=120956 RepID=A0A1G7RTA2_9LACT|nr:DUF5052 family protein [Facklamia miroungae]NKZ29283.1 DUF5052 family protein [Facklamia miroungae]SDG13976.1 protein of unknown function [Facklamia miroungae]